MKHVVIVGADFLPSSLPPAIRIRFFAQHLPEFGWKPTVVTTEPQYYESPVDKTSENILPESLEVIRTSAFSAKFTRKIGIGDIGMRSLWQHWRALSNLCHRRQVDLIFIPVPPYVSMVLGRLAYGQFGIPYVIDYIDPWVTDYYWKLPKSQRPPKWALSYFLARMLEPYALKYAAGITGVSRGTTDSVIARYPQFNRLMVAEIPYGGEPKDFDYLRCNPRKNFLFNKDDGLLHFSYVGACPVSMHSTVLAIFKAVRLGLQETPELFSRIRLHFIGTSYAPKAKIVYQVLPLAKEIGIADHIVEFPSRIAYLDALQVLLDSHALFIVGSEEPHYTASKVFPNILARRPLLAVLHENSSVVSILRQTDAGAVVTFNSEHPAQEKVREIARCLKDILLLPQDYQPSIRWESFEAYTARAMTGRLSEVFNKAVQKRI